MTCLTSIKATPSRLLLDCLNRQSDPHFVPDQKSTSFKRRVPREAELLPIERDARFEAAPPLAPRILGRAKVRDRQRDLLGDAANPQRADNVIGIVAGLDDPRASEREHWMG